MEYYVSLALEYFAAKALKDRTLDALSGIVAHVALTYCLGVETGAEVLRLAEARARQRGLLR